MANMKPLQSDRVITAIVAVVLAACGGAAVVFGLDFVAWLFWGIIFVVLELRALINDERDDTLSEQIWKGTLSKHFVWSVFWKTTVFSFLTWLAYHLTLGK